MQGNSASPKSWWGEARRGADIRCLATSASVRGVRIVETNVAAATTVVVTVAMTVVTVAAAVGMTIVEAVVGMMIAEAVVVTTIAEAVVGMTIAEAVVGMTIATGTVVIAEEVGMKLVAAAAVCTMTIVAATSVVNRRFSSLRSESRFSPRTPRRAGPTSKRKPPTAHCLKSARRFCRVFNHVRGRHQGRT